MYYSYSINFTIQYKLNIINKNILTVSNMSNSSNAYIYSKWVYLI